MLTDDQVETLSAMEPGIHYPDRSMAFSFEKSEVIQNIQRSLGVTFADAKKIFSAARKARVILFNPDTREWMGKTEFERRFKT